MIGAVVSAGVGSVKWLGIKQPSEDNLNRILPWAERFSMPRSQYLLRLAEIKLSREAELLLLAIEEEPGNRQALLKLALLEEFRGDRIAAQRWIDQAMELNHSYKSYLAGLAQASRWKDLERMERIATLAFEYCPREADGVYAELCEIEQATKILMKQSLARQTDFLRFLLGQNQIAEAFEFQALLPRTESTDRYRLELCEMMFWSGRKNLAAKLFGFMHPEFAALGVFNANLRSKPSSMAFDWRLRQDSSVRSHWRPGELEVNVASHENPLELVSIFIRPGARRLYRALPVWNGEIAGLYWEASDAESDLQRFVLMAPPGAERRFVLIEVRFE